MEAIALTFGTLSIIGFLSLVNFFHKRYRHHRDMKRWEKRHKASDSFMLGVIDDIERKMYKKTTLQKYCNHKSIRELR